MDIQTLIDEYAAWLRSEITFQQVGEYYEITAPYLDSANDYLQIYVRQEGDEILFSDDGAVAFVIPFDDVNHRRILHKCHI